MPKCAGCGKAAVGEMSVPSCDGCLERVKSVLLILNPDEQTIGSEDLSPERREAIKRVREIGRVASDAAAFVLNSNQSDGQLGPVLERINRIWGMLQGLEQGKPLKKMLN